MEIAVIVNALIYRRRGGQALFLCRKLAVKAQAAAQRVRARKELHGRQSRNARSSSDNLCRYTLRRRHTTILLARSSSPSPQETILFGRRRALLLAPSWCRLVLRKASSALVAAHFRLPQPRFSARRATRALHGSPKYHTVRLCSPIFFRATAEKTQKRRANDGDESDEKREARKTARETCLPVRFQSKTFGSLVPNKLVAHRRPCSA
jgi:hypothetical protein